MVVYEAEEVYSRAGIPLMKHERAMQKIIRAHEEYSGLLRNKKRETTTEKDKRDTFLQKIRGLCDFSSLNAIDIISKDRNR